MENHSLWNQFHVPQKMLFVNIIINIVVIHSHYRSHRLIITINIILAPSFWWNMPYIQNAYFDVCANPTANLGLSRHYLDPVVLDTAWCVLKLGPCSVIGSRFIGLSGRPDLLTCHLYYDSGQKFQEWRSKWKVLTFSLGSSMVSLHWSCRMMANLMLLGSQKSFWSIFIEWIWLF